MNYVSHWRVRARKAIDAVHATLPADISLKDRKKAIQNAYPFGERKRHPYKQWCIEQKHYLAQFVKSSNDIPASHLSPLERAIAKSKAGE